jgi:ABC-2 type transport system ATP-binding protein
VPEPIVVLSNVSKTYSGHRAVAELSLRVPKGVIYGLLGPNGAGKTTTIRMINDILKPDEGTITLFGGLSPGAAALHRIGYLPEERGLYQKMTVRRVLTYLGELRGLSRAALAPRVERWIERLGLADWIDRKVENLSKGMQQKVQFVAAVLNDPDLVILDEPFSGLDPINAGVLREIVLEQRAAGKTVLFSTHLMEHAEQLCDEICILSRSRKVLEGGLIAIKAEARDARRGVIIELRNGPDATGDMPAPLVPGSAAGITRTARTARGHEVTLAPGADPRALLRNLLDAGLDLVRFELAAPSLHDIFVERVQAGAASSPPQQRHSEGAS